MRKDLPGTRPQALWLCVKYSIVFYALLEPGTPHLCSGRYGGGGGLAFLSPPSSLHRVADAHADFVQQYVIG